MTATEEAGRSEIGLRLDMRSERVSERSHCGEAEGEELVWLDERGEGQLFIFGRAFIH